MRAPRDNENAVCLELMCARWLKVSIGHIAIGYAGLLLIGSATISIGLFASLARRQ
jgi:hypothetical protein